GRSPPSPAVGSRRRSASHPATMCWTRSTCAPGSTARMNRSRWCRSLSCSGSCRRGVGEKMPARRERTAASSEQEADMRIGKVAGFELRIHWSTLVIFGLLVWSLATVQLPEQDPDASGTAHVVAALIAGVAFYVAL